MVVATAIIETGVDKLVKLIKDFQFKPIAEGDVTFRNPFVFFRQGT